MSSNKVRKVVPSLSQLRGSHGPATAALEFNEDTQALEYNPAGTFYQLVPVIIEDSVPDSSDLAPAGALWLRATGPTVYMNVGTYDSPDWNTITQS